MSQSETDATLALGKSYAERMRDAWDRAIKFNETHIIGKKVTLDDGRETIVVDKSFVLPNGDVVVAIKSGQVVRIERFTN